METPLKYSIGFDCSKDEFAACFSLMYTNQRVVVKSTRKFKNSAKGFNNADYWIKQSLLSGKDLRAGS